MRGDMPAAAENLLSAVGVRRAGRDLKFAESGPCLTSDTTGVCLVLPGS